MNNEKNYQGTTTKILQGAPLPECFISKRYHTDDEIMKSKSVLHTSELQDRLHKEELFLVSLLSEVRNEHRPTEVDCKEFYNSLQYNHSIDPLPFQWLNNCTLSTKVRMHLAEKLLPTVVLGLEHILREAYHRGLCKLVYSETGVEEMDVRMDPNFNPLNRLAEFLMRNNPKFIDSIINTCRSPYTKAMRQVVDKLKRIIFLRSCTDLAKYTIDSEKRKDNTEAEKQLKDQYLAEKLCLIEPLFNHFRLEGKDTINFVIIQQSVRSFMHIVMKMPHDLSLIQRPIIYVENVEEKVVSCTLQEFMTYVMFYVQPLSMEAFHTFVSHMQRCGKEYLDQVNRNIKLDHVADVSVSCDMEIAKIGKERLYEEFNRFAQEADAEIQRNIVHPKDWCIQEYHMRNAESATKNEVVEEMVKNSLFQIVDTTLNIAQFSSVNPDDQDDNKTNNDDNVT